MEKINTDYKDKFVTFRLVIAQAFMRLLACVILHCSATDLNLTIN